MNILSKKDKKNLLIIVLITLIHNFIVFPAQAAANNKETVNQVIGNNKVIIKSADSKKTYPEQLKANTDKKSQLEIVNDFKLPEIQKSDESFQITLLENDNNAIKNVVLTAYNSLPNQTDSDPCTTANGFNLCASEEENTVATNILPFGTKIMIPELFGDKVFVVRDRMSKRFSNRVDVWMKSYQDAINFGVQKADIIIVK